MPQLSRVLPACMGLALRLAAAVLLVGCAPMPAVDSAVQARQLVHDELFPAAPAVPKPEQVFAMSDAMRRFADHELAAIGPAGDPRRRLLQALRDGGRLQLAYDDGYTGTAAESFDRREGNCLSLAIMMASFARHLGLPVRFQSVQLQPQYSRTGGITLSSGHVNLLLGRLPATPKGQPAGTEDLVVDFVTAEALRGRRVQVLSESTVLAMYMNNRAAENLTGGQPAAAYAWARQGLLIDPDYLPGINTLAVVYLRSGHLPQAEAALRLVLARDPGDEAALTNLVATLKQAGRVDEALAFGRRLAELRAHPPFHFLDLGLQALRNGDADQARQLIGRELRRQPHQPEVLFWAAIADLSLGDRPGAEAHLSQAVEFSDTPAQQARYSAKLAALRDPARR